MKLDLAEKIAKTVLYEGYILYPYGPSSLKNQQRWTFGSLCPQTYSQNQDHGTEAWSMQTDCLVVGDPNTSLDIRVRFLHLFSRTVAERTWQEAVEREIPITGLKLNELCAQQQTHLISFASSQTFLPGAQGGIEQRGLQGVVKISACEVEKNLYSVLVQVQNLTGSNEDILCGPLSKEEALMQSFLSTHTLLSTENGSFPSLLDPPESMREVAAARKNIGTWPVLIGDPSISNTAPIMLSSPIILYDFPQIAPESPSDLFDATEIDEILSLRIMTLSENEKREMRESDPRTAALLERVESLDSEDLQKMHGILRRLDTHSAD
jgi:hypothetical protein